MIKIFGEEKCPICEKDIIPCIESNNEYAVHHGFVWLNRNAMIKDCIIEKGKK